VQDRALALVIDFLNGVAERADILREERAMRRAVASSLSAQAFKLSKAAADAADVAAAAAAKAQRSKAARAAATAVAAGTTPAGQSAESEPDDVESLVIALLASGLDAERCAACCDQLDAAIVDSAHAGAVCSAGGLDVVLAALRVHACDAAAVGAGCAVLMRLCSFEGREGSASGDCMPALVHGGAIEALVGGARRHAESDAVVQHAFTALRALASSHAAHAQRVIQAGALTLRLPRRSSATAQQLLRELQACLQPMAAAQADAAMAELLASEEAERAAVEQRKNKAAKSKSRRKGRGGGGGGGTSCDDAPSADAQPEDAYDGEASHGGAAGEDAQPEVATTQPPAAPPAASSAQLIDELFPWMRADSPPLQPAVDAPTAAAAVLPPAAPAPTALETALAAALAKAEEEVDATKCVICLDAQRSCVMLPCKHLAVCSAPACAAMLGAPPRCPLCRVAVSDTMQLFV
jgi:hypothetical protein